MDNYKSSSKGGVSARGGRRRAARSALPRSFYRCEDPSCGKFWIGARAPTYGRYALMADTVNIVEMRHISKSFPGVKALGRRQRQRARGKRARPHGRERRRQVHPHEVPLRDLRAGRGRGDPGRPQGHLRRHKAGPRRRHLDDPPGAPSHPLPQRDGEHLAGPLPDAQVRCCSSW